MKGRMMKAWHRNANRWVVALAALSAAAAVGAAEPAPRWVEARAKHNGSGVLLRYTEPVALKSGQAGTVKLQLSRVVAADGATVELKPSDAGLVLRVNGQPLTGPLRLNRDELRELDVQVQAATDGLYHLNVFTYQNGRMSASSVAVKVGSGAARQKAEGSVQTTPKGEAVIALPGR